MHVHVWQVGGAAKIYYLDQEIPDWHTSLIILPITCIIQFRHTSRLGSFVFIVDYYYVYKVAYYYACKVYTTPRQPGGGGV